MSFLERPRPPRPGKTERAGCDLVARPKLQAAEVRISRWLGRKIVSNPSSGK
jgi:hypothetical protein